MKPRKKDDKCDKELQRRLVAERTKGAFQTYNLAIEDLQEVEILAKRKNLGKGELSSIAFAKRTLQAFLTDDQKATKLALAVIPGFVQTTPHLLGWLVYEGTLEDSDTAYVIAEHEAMNGPLAKSFDEICETAQRYRSVSIGSN
jgi:hypothetical protein